MANPTFTPALKVRSTTAPDFTFRSLVRTNAPPFPGLTCWNSMIWYSVPSRSSVIPRLRSLVLTLMAPVLLPARSQRHQLLGRRRDDTASVGGDLHHVLDPHPTYAGKVDARLDRHDGPFRQHVVRRHTQGRPLMDLQADPMSEAMLERWTVP